MSHKDSTSQHHRKVGSILGRVVMKEKWAKTETSADYLSLVLALLSVLCSFHMAYFKEMSVYK